jgi:ADP-ribose pyrophosphatase YjhB (NUDIX family)
MDDREPVNLRCAVLVLRANAVLLCRRTEEADTWVLPGGTPRSGEATAAAARREVAEETGLNIVADRVAFVLETSSRDAEHDLIEIVFIGAEDDPLAQPRQLEAGLAPSFVALDGLEKIGLRPPIAGYIRGYARALRTRRDPRWSTAAYLGNVWRPVGADEVATSKNSIG